MEKGGRSNVQNELLCRLIFPERLGALMKFLSALSPRWNISMFHYRSQDQSLSLGAMKSDNVEVSSSIQEYGTKMNHDGLSANLTDKAIATIFTDFMTRYTMLEELVDAGEGLLRGFYRGQEMLRGTGFSKASSVVDDLIKGYYTDSLIEYVDAEFSTYYNGVRNMKTLDSCKSALEDHLPKAKALLDELENLKNSATDKINHSMDEHFSDFESKYSEDPERKQSDSVQKCTEEILLPEESVIRAALMTIIYNMLKLDYTTQEKIIGSLNPMVSPSELESYCRMWRLRPYVNPSAIHMAWAYLSR